MVYSFLSLTLVLAGIGTAAAVLFFSVAAALRNKQGIFLFYTAPALAYGAAMLRFLGQALSPYACSRLEEPVLLASGLLLALHVYFIVRLTRWRHKP